MTLLDRAGHATVLRRAFDASFAQPPPPSADDAPALAVHVAGEVLAVPLAGLCAVVTDHVVVPLPGGPPELLGIAAVRGELLSVHSLAALLGRTDPSRGPRTLLVVDRGAAIALAVDRVEGQIRLPRAALATPDGGTLRAAAGIDGARWLVVDLASVLRSLRAAGSERPGGNGGER